MGGVKKPLKSLCFGALVICVCLGYAYAGPSGGTVTGPGDNFGEVDVQPAVDCSNVTCYKRGYSECNTEVGKACCEWDGVCFPQCVQSALGIQPGCDSNGDACKSFQYFSKDACVDCKNMSDGKPGNWIQSGVQLIWSPIAYADWSPHTGIVEKNGKCPWQVTCKAGNNIVAKGCELCDLGYISSSDVTGIFYPEDSTHENFCTPCYQTNISVGGTSGLNNYDSRGVTSNEKRTACNAGVVRIKTNNQGDDPYNYLYIYYEDEQNQTSKKEKISKDWFADSANNTSGSKKYDAGTCRALKCEWNANPTPNGASWPFPSPCDTEYIYKDVNDTVSISPGEPIRTLTLVDGIPCPKDYYCPGGTGESAADPKPCPPGMVTDGPGKKSEDDCQITNKTKFCDSKGCFKIPMIKNPIPYGG